MVRNPFVFYFLLMLCLCFPTDGLMESRQEEIVLQDMNETVFKDIVDYFYCGKMEIDDSNVQDLISISGLLQLRRIQEACCEFMKRQINTNNCLGKQSSIDTETSNAVSFFAFQYGC